MFGSKTVKWSWVLPVVVGLLILAACTAVAPAGEQTTATGEEPVELVIWTAYGKQLAPAVDAYNAKMQEEGKNIKVTGTELAFDSIADKFAVAATTGDVPDILDLDLVLAPKFTSMGALTDLTDKVAEAGFQDDFNPKFLDLGVWEDKIYMLPFSADVSALFYNKDIFAAAGLDPEKPPQTWEEFAAALQAIKDANLTTADGQPVYPFATAAGPGGKMFCDMPFLWTNGGNWLNDEGEVIINAPETAEAMQWYTDLILQDGMIPPNPSAYTWEDKMNDFYSGKAAVVCSGSYTLEEVKSRAADLNYGVFLFPHPEGKGEATSFIGGDVIGIPTASKHPEEAWDFIQYALSEPVQVDVWARNGLPPVRESMTQNEYFDADPRYYTFSDGVHQGQVPKTVFYNDLYAPWNVIWDEVFAGDKPLDQILNEAADEMNKIVSR